MDREKKPMPGDYEAQMRRQMGSTQMKRFLNSLPQFSVDEDLPTHMQDLLRRLDRPKPLQ
jgi:hypothetical protein